MLGLDPTMKQEVPKNDRVWDTDILKHPTYTLVRLELNATLLDTPPIHPGVFFFIFFFFILFTESLLEFTESNFYLNCEPEMFLIFFFFPPPPAWLLILQAFMYIPGKRTMTLKIKTCSKGDTGIMFCMTDLGHVALSIILELLLHLCGFSQLICFPANYWEDIGFQRNTDVGKNSVMYSAVCIASTSNFFFSSELLVIDGDSWS